MKSVLVVALALFCSLTPVQAAPKATPQSIAPSAALSAKVARLKAEVAQAQAILGQSPQDEKRTQARARLKAQVRERRRQLIKIESGSKEV